MFAVCKNYSRSKEFNSRGFANILVICTKTLGLITSIRVSHWNACPTQGLKLRHVADWGLAWWPQTLGYLSSQIMFLGVVRSDPVNVSPFDHKSITVGRQHTKINSEDHYYLYTTTILYYTIYYTISNFPEVILQNHKYSEKSES